jgi:hypothetical protein
MSLKALILPLLLASLVIPSNSGATTTENTAVGVTTPDKGPAEASGSLRGTVKDSAGAVLQGARIVLDPTAAAGRSGAQGDYLIQNVKPGAYTVTISYVGFTNSVSTVVVKAGQATPLDATLDQSAGCGHGRTGGRCRLRQ